MDGQRLLQFICPRPTSFIIAARVNLINSPMCESFRSYYSYKQSAFHHTQSLIKCESLSTVTFNIYLDVGLISKYERQHIQVEHSAALQGHVVVGAESDDGEWWLQDY